VQLQIHLGHGILHALVGGGRGFDQVMAVTHLGAQLHDLGGGPEVGAQQAYAM